MPITMPFEMEPITQDEFGKIAYGVMEQVFKIHDQYGRFLNETLVKRELSERLNGIDLEVPITTTFKNYSKLYFMDVLIHRRGLFEFKCVEAIHPRHRAQTLNYLLLSGLNHAKVVNTRPTQVQHEFVNCHSSRLERCQPKLNNGRWNRHVEFADDFARLLLDIIADWGTGLELRLYQEALCHFLVGPADVPIRGKTSDLGTQLMPLVTPDIAFKLTAFKSGSEAFEIHAKRLLEHTPLQAIFWANIAHHRIELVTLKR